MEEVNAITYIISRSKLIVKKMEVMQRKGCDGLLYSNELLITTDKN